MATKGGPEHEKLLEETCSRLRSEGWVVVPLKGKSPDAVAAKDGKMIAVEILARYGKEGKFKLKQGTYEGKRRAYLPLGFDDVLFGTVKLDYQKRRPTGWFAKTQRILNPP